MSETARPRFYEGQYLEADDLTAVVDYERLQRARVLVGAHRWGIALGLDLTEVPGPNGVLDVVLQPGYAWDGYGRPILVPEPVRLPVSVFAALDATFVSGSPPPPPQLVDVWIRYDEKLTRGPRPGFETCSQDSAYSRAEEGYALEAGSRPDAESRRDEIVIAGRSIDAALALRTFDPAAALLEDASVPQQDFPDEGDFARWLLPLGVVNYQPGEPGTFLPRDPAGLQRHRESRQYAGVVAGSVEATGGVVRVHDRSKPYEPHHTGELLSVEGDVRADGDVRLYDGRVDFRISHSESPVQPFGLLRSPDPVGNSSALTLVIGDQSAGDNRLVVGPKTGTDAQGRDTHEPHLVVTDAGNVGVRIDRPTAPLHVPADGVQWGDDPAADRNFHIQADTGAKTLRFLNNNVGAGVPLVAMTSTGRVGIGATSPTHPLHVDATMGIRQRSLFLSGDDRWSSLTFNAHHDAANGAWVFPDPSKPAATIELDAAAGPPRFEVWTTPQGDNRNWVSRLLVSGHTGDVALAHNGGNVGVGTASPTARLDVRGDVLASGAVRFQGLQAVGAAVGLRIVWGSVRMDGTIRSGDGFVVARRATGQYLVTFTVPFAGPGTMLVSRVYGDLDLDAHGSVDPAETVVLDYLDAVSAVVATASASDSAANGGFTFLALGPR